MPAELGSRSCVLVEAGTDETAHPPVDGGQAAYMSERTFSKYLRSATGLTLSAMVKKLHIALRKRLFDTTTASIAQVAELSGYRTMANFNRQFLAEVGATPTAHRNLESSQKPPAEGFSLGLQARVGAGPTPDPGIPGWPVG